MKLPRTVFQTVLEVLCLLCLALQFLLPAVLWSRLPDPMPIQFNAAGEIDGWGSRWTMFLFPGISLAMWLFLGLVTRLDPRKWNMPFSVPWGREVPVFSAVKTMLTALKLETMLIFAGEELVLITGASGLLSLAVWSPVLATIPTMVLGLVIAWRRRFR